MDTLLNLGSNVSLIDMCGAAVVALYSSRFHFYQPNTCIPFTLLFAFFVPTVQRVSHSMKIDNRSIERVEEFKYLGTTLTNKNSIQEEIKSRLKVRNACYYSVHNLLSSSLLSKKLKINIYRTIILPVVLYGCETWSLTLRGERRLRVFENRV